MSYVFLITVTLAIGVGEGRGQQSGIEQRLAELHQELKDLRDARRQQILEELGERFEILMERSVEELQLALEMKVRDKYQGASIISAEDDPVFLGTIEDSIKRESIFNDVGPYGSNTGRHSIWNEVGRYGGPVGRYSPFNSVTRTPPLIVKDDKVIGRLTVNPVVSGAVEPSLLKLCFTW
ncbi:MAG: hypothetical protein WD534_01530 [Phycisphaeraceae bacterium]